MRGGSAHVGGLFCSILTLSYLGRCIDTGADGKTTIGSVIVLSEEMLGYAQESSAA